jgi:hypothetical protein
VVVFAEMVEFVDNIYKFEKFSLFVETMMGYVLVIYRFVCVCEIVTAEIQTGLK